MGFTYNISDPRGTYFVTFATVQWVDVFTRKRYVDIFLDSIRHCQKEKGLLIHAWCLMSNHFHMIASTKEIKPNLSDNIRDLKKFTSTKIIESIKDETEIESRRGWMLWLFKSAGNKNPNNVNYQFWRQDNHPEEIFTKDFMESKLDYIHNNPVSAGIVENAEDYLLSSARDYLTNKKGLLEIDFV
jgi:putative transposase